MRANQSPPPLAWYCVHDHRMRQVYLGTDEAAAKKLAVEGCVIGRGTTRGNAMRLAALANRPERRKRFGAR